MQTDYGQSSYASEHPAGSGPAPPMAPWIEVLSFAGIMMLVLGAFQIVEGLDALTDQKVYLFTSDNSLIEVNATVWGWVHLALGAVTVATGTGVLLGQTWARVIGIVLTAGAALSHFFFLAAAPLWISILISVELLVIYALAVHGRDIRSRP